MKKIIFILLMGATFFARGQNSLPLPYGYKNIHTPAMPPDFYAYDVSTSNAWATTSAILAAVPVAQRYAGQIFLVGDPVVEYTFVSDAAASAGTLTIKSSGAGGGWNLTGTTALTGDVDIDGNGFAHYIAMNGYSFATRANGGSSTVGTESQIYTDNNVDIKSYSDYGSEFLTRLYMQKNNLIMQSLDVLGGSSSAITITPDNFLLDAPLLELAGGALAISTANSVVTKSYVDNSAGWKTNGATTLTANSTINLNNHDLLFSGNGYTAINATTVSLDAGGGTPQASIAMSTYDNVNNNTTEFGLGSPSAISGGFNNLKIAGGTYALASTENTDNNTIKTAFTLGRNLVQSPGGTAIGIGAALDFSIKNAQSVGGYAPFGRLSYSLTNVTSGSEQGKYNFGVSNAGSTTSILELDRYGARYLADYSANYTTRSLIDLAYFNSHSAGGGSGVTNTAINNEVGKSNGTNIVPSGIFSTSLSNLNLGGTASTGTSRVFGTDGSSANIDMIFSPKGTGKIFGVTSGLVKFTAGNTIQLQSTNSSDASIVLDGIGSTSSISLTASNNILVGDDNTVSYNSTVAPTSNSITPRSYVDGAKTFTGKQTFTTTSTTAGGNLGVFAGDPSVTVNGDIWYNSVIPSVRTKVNGVIISLGASSGGTVTGVTATAPVVSTGTTAPVISMAASTNSVDGYLTATDHTTFAAKQATLTNGSGTTVSGTTVNLGGTTTGTTTVTGPYEVLYQNTLPSDPHLQLSSFDLVNSTGTGGAGLAILKSSQKDLQVDGNSEDKTNVSSMTMQSGVSFDQTVTGLTTGYVQEQGFSINSGQFNVSLSNTDPANLVDMSFYMGGNTLTIGSYGNTTASGKYSFAYSDFGSASGDYSHLSGAGFSSSKTLTATGKSSFIHSENTTAQTAGHGANAANSAILGGINLNIPSTAIGSTITASNAGKVSASVLYTLHSDNLRIKTLSYFGNFTTTPTSTVQIAAGTATVSPFGLTSGTDLTTAAAGKFEYNGTRLAFSPSTTRKRVPLTNDVAPSNGQIPIGNGTDYTAAAITQGAGITVTNGSGSITVASANLSGSAALDFASTSAQTSSSLTITVTGAALNDVVALGVPNGAVNANSSYYTYVSATNTVTVVFNNYSSGAIDPASGTFNVKIIK